MDLRDIDRLVAEHVMGWQMGAAGGLTCWFDRATSGLRVCEDWRPTEEIGDAWQLVEQLREADFHLAISSRPMRDQATGGVHDVWRVSLLIPSGSRMQEAHVAEAPTPELAVCMVALASKRIKVTQTVEEEVADA